MTSASDTAYLTIRDLIVEGKLRPGDLLIAEELAKRCGVSRTPVREAIQRLQSELFAQRLDNKRTVVRSWSADEIEDFFELRLRLAGYMAARAAQRITTAQLAQLKAVHGRMQTLSAAEHDGEAFSRAHEGFYQLLGEIAGSERLQLISWRIINSAPPFVRCECSVQAADTEMVRDHEDLIMALEAQDPVWAEAAMTVRLRKTYRRSQLV